MLNDGLHPTGNWQGLVGPLGSGTLGFAVQIKSGEKRLEKRVACISLFGMIKHMWHGCVWSVGNHVDPGCICATVAGVEE
jgi:hypothetical protein